MACMRVYACSFVEAQLANEAVHTKIISRTNFPVWDQEFTLQMAQSEEKAQHQLQLVGKSAQPCCSATVGTGQAAV